MIAEGKVVSQGKRCCVVHWVDPRYEGHLRVAVVSRHSDEAQPEDLVEALELLQFDQGQHILKEFDTVAGHWGVQSIPAGEVATIGKSVVRSS